MKVLVIATCTISVVLAAVSLVLAIVTSATMWVTYFWLFLLLAAVIRLIGFWSLPVSEYRADPESWTGTGGWGGAGWSGGGGSGCGCGPGCGCH